MVIAACSLPGRIGKENVPFLPPTQASVSLFASPTSTANPIQEVVRPTPTPSCTDQLTFLEDLTIPDGSVVQPGAALDKRWRMKNSGTCNWDKTYHVRLVSGEAVGLPVEQSLYPARGGSEFQIRMEIKAPADPGYYRIAWQAYNPQGEAFGDPFFVEISVQSP
jgi:hypothetical protein